MRYRTTGEQEPARKPRGRLLDSLNRTDPITALIVDDEKMIRSLLKMSLQRMGYEIVVASSGPEALEIFEQRPFDLVLLDILMPEMDGFTVCSELRKISDVPIIMLTALNRPDDIVRGLELGADNYITKPFTFKEVEARIRAILRRTVARPDTHPAHVLEQGDVKLDADIRAVTVGENLIELTRTEYELLNYLMAHADRPVSKEDLLQHVWGYEADESNSNIVELAIRRLRKKMEDNPSVPNRLLTVRGVGYKFVPRFPPQRAGTTSGVQHRRATATFRSAPRSHSGEIYATNALEDEDEESELQSEQKQ